MLDDDIGRVDDHIALGHEKMWNILAYNRPYSNVVELIDTAFSLYPDDTVWLGYLKELEYIVEYVIPPYKAEWTIMLYICGSDLESGARNDDGTWESNEPAGYASMDIEEILQVKNKPSNVNVLIETGGAKRWKNANIDPNNLCRFVVTNKNGNSVLTRKDTLPYSGMGKQTTFESFLNWGFRYYPAKKTGVILWNHGGGFGCCSDEIIDGDLDDKEVAGAFENTLYKNRLDKIEFIGYDACLMQLQDVAEFNSKYCNYMIGSENTEPAEGWRYDLWIDDVYAKKSTTNILKEIADTYIPIAGSYDTLSVLDLSKMANYKNKFESVASTLSTAPYASLFQVVQGTHRFSYNGRNNGTIDGLDFLKRLNNSTLSNYNGLQAKISSAISAYNQVVIYNKTGNAANGKANGMSIYFAGAKKGAQATYDAAVASNTLPKYLLNILLSSLNSYEDPEYLSRYTHFTTWRSLCF